MQQLGFQVGFRPYVDERGGPVAEDGSVTRFFPGAMALIGLDSVSGLPARLREYVDYFGSAYENSLAHLVLFAAAFLVLFLGKRAGEHPSTSGATCHSTIPGRLGHARQVGNRTTQSGAAGDAGTRTRVQDYRLRSHVHSGARVW